VLWHKDVKAQHVDHVVTSLPWLKNLTHTSKTYQVKNAHKWLQPLGSWFTCFLAFQTAEDQTQWNSNTKRCEVWIRTVARKSCARGLDISLPSKKIVHWVMFVLVHVQLHNHEDTPVKCFKR